MMLPTPLHLSGVNTQCLCQNLGLLQTRMEKQDNYSLSPASGSSLLAASVKGSNSASISISSDFRISPSETSLPSHAHWTLQDSYGVAGVAGSEGPLICNVGVNTCAEPLDHLRPDAFSRLARLPSVGGDSMDAQDGPYHPQLGRQNSDLSEPSPSDHRPMLPTNGAEISSPDNSHSEAELDSTQNDKLPTVAISVKRSRASCTGCVHLSTEDDRSSMASESCVKSEPYPEASPLGNDYKLSKLNAESNNSGSQDTLGERNGCDTCVTSTQPTHFDEFNEVLMWRRPPVERSEELTSAEAPLSTACRNSLRSCKLCGTTKTPLWRSGPQGPKSLCNACGIRYKKARRSQAASGYPDLELSPPRTPTPEGFSSRPLKRKLLDDQEEIIVNVRSRQRLKRSKWPALRLVSKSLIPKVEDTESCLTSPGTPSPRKRISQNMPSASSRRKEAAAKLALIQQQGRLTNVLTMDEEEAAVLLMALSCGLVLA